MEPKTKNYYIAFSIHGTNSFIVATRSMTEKEYKEHMASRMLFPLTSRLPKPLPGHTKLGWTRLNTKDGTPLRSPPLILSRFSELAKNGWTVDKEKFVEKHYRGKHARSVSR